MAKNVAQKNAASCGNPSTRKNIYVLQGDGNSGKSSTIKEIYRILSIKYPNCIAFPKHKKSTTKCGYDMKIMLNIKVKVEKEYEDILVGINSAGDIESNVGDRLDDFAKEECNIIFCAENSSKDSTKGKVDKWNKQNLQTKYEVIALSVSDLQNKFSNMNYAQKIHFYVAEYILKKYKLIKGPLVCKK